MIAAVAIVLALIVYGGCTAIVPTGYTGILTTFGKVADYTLDAGFHLKSPFQVVTVMDNREQKTSYNTQAFSSDIQQVQVIGLNGTYTGTAQDVTESGSLLVRADEDGGVREVLAADVSVRGIMGYA